MHNLRELSIAFAENLFIFFFQAEDGIRDGHVTGVQTCALPISMASFGILFFFAVTGLTLNHAEWFSQAQRTTQFKRSEERRVGKECRLRWLTANLHKKENSTSITLRLSVNSLDVA